MKKAIALWGCVTLIGFVAFHIETLSAEPPVLLDPATHPKFVNALPMPARIDATAMGKYDIEMRETSQWLGLYDGGGKKLMTTVWGYGFPGKGVTYPGPTFVAKRGVSVEVKWKNKLPRYNFPDGPGAHLLPVDPTVHIAHPCKGGIPTVTHLHGGLTESASDGLPEAWFTQGFQERGPDWVKMTYHYDNDQEAATLWYHDHALGITRLNVYAGLAGFYFLRDDNENSLIGSYVLPGGPYEREIVIQDRMFASDGSLFYPSEDPPIEPGFDPLPEGPSIIAEFFGNFIIVNATALPLLDVEPRKYRFRLLNGSDSRFYILMFDNEMTFYQIGTDEGLLPTPVPLSQLLIGPGERADLVVDFTEMEGEEIILENYGPDEPFKGFNPDGSLSDGAGGVLPSADPATTGQIFKIRVNQELNTTIPNASVGMGTPLRPEIPPLEQTGATRQLVLFEGLDNYGRLQPLLGTLEEGSLGWFEPITENPMLDDVEVWEIYNSTEDAHPIHLHMVSFQIVNRESFEGWVEEKEQHQHDGSMGVGGILHVTSLGEDERDPEPNEDGWKDTAIMLPGEVTRVIAKFTRPGLSAWHCHILSHEDHEMMRPYYIGSPSLSSESRPYREEGIPGTTSLLQIHPNPFFSSTEIRFSLSKPSHVQVKIFNLIGENVATLLDGEVPAGLNSVKLNAENLASGIYFYRLTARNGLDRSSHYTETRRMILMKSH